jgi:hypothetical protein
MSHLADLKSHCMITRNLSLSYPNNKEHKRRYKLAQRAVQAKEREVFCSIEEPK